MKRFTGFVVFVVCSLVFAGYALAEIDHIPLLMKILVQGNVSISPEQLEVVNEFLSDLATRLVIRTDEHLLQEPDRISIVHFGDAEESTGTKFLDCSNLREMERLYEVLNTMGHPQYTSAAIYDALAQETYEMLQRNKMLPGSYLKVVVLLTDGTDTGSTPQAKDFIKKVYPRKDIYFVVVGLDDQTKTEELRKIADYMGKIEVHKYINYDEYY